ncbi:MAG: hypothetical protein JWL72_2176 [Ilumatobacteraceae bacterium]|nr:hypothetical protein [Ilumatobacteraceae bacterium]
MFNRTRHSPASISIVAGLAGIVFAVAPAAASAERPTPAAFNPPTALDTVNFYRGMAGVGAVALDGSITAGAVSHSCYMLQNGISHDEQPGRAGYTQAGDDTGNKSNVAVSSAASMTDQAYVELWMSGPFHAIGILRPDLASVGYGSCVDSSTNPWHSGATLDVLSGLPAWTPPSAPVVWPGDGTTTSLSQFVAESPNPVTLCGWPSGGGLPVIAMLPEAPRQVSATITGPAGPVQSCALSAENVSDTTARAILQSSNAVTVVPRNRLDPGTYTVVVTTAVRTVRWSFTVDPSATVTNLPAPTAPAPTVPTAPTPVADTAVLASPGGFTTVAPFRLADTRQGLGGTRLTAGQVRRIQVTGVGSVPAGATAISANFTAVLAALPGFDSVYGCDTTVPNVSTVNFDAAAIVANAAIVPLDANGGVCVFSNTSVDLVVDVNGFVAPSSPGRFVPTDPRRVMDTRTDGGTSARLAAGETRELRIAGRDAAVPTGATAVVLNVTAVNAGVATFVTTFPCTNQRPVVSSVNVVSGAPQSNTAIVPLSRAGSVCFYSPHEVDLVVDLAGYMIEGPGLRFTPLAATRLVDTRDRQVALDLGGGGSPLTTGATNVVQLAGTRGVPADAVVVSLNITATGTTGNGFLSVWPCSIARPVVSSLNAVEGRTVSAAVTGALSDQGALCVYNQPSTHIVVDINGFWS